MTTVPLFYCSFPVFVIYRHDLLELLPFSGLHNFCTSTLVHFALAADATGSQAFHYLCKLPQNSLKNVVRQPLKVPGI